MVVFPQSVVYTVAPAVLGLIVGNLAISRSSAGVEGPAKQHVLVLRLIGMTAVLFSFVVAFLSTNEPGLPAHRLLMMGVAGFACAASMGFIAASTVPTLRQKPEAFGKALVITVLAEPACLFAFIISFLSLGKIAPGTGVAPDFSVAGSVAVAVGVLATAGVQVALARRFGMDATSDAAAFARRLPMFAAAELPALLGFIYAFMTLGAA